MAGFGPHPAPSQQVDDQQACKGGENADHSLCRELFKALGLENVHIIRGSQNRDIGHTVAKICRYYNLQIPNREWLCSGLLQAVLTLLSNEVHSLSRKEATRGTDKISELICHIKGAQNMNMTVAQCAAFCNMSQSHFARVFKNITGQPPVRFMLELRMERAKDLLDFTDMSIAEIAEASGFPDQNYFARTFKKSTGLSPTQYRRTGKTE